MYFHTEAHSTCHHSHFLFSFMHFMQRGDKHQVLVVHAIYRVSLPQYDINRNSASVIVSAPITTPSTRYINVQKTVYTDLS